MLSKGSKRKRRRHGFLKRMRSPGGRRVIRNRRSKKRAKINSI